MTGRIYANFDRLKLAARQADAEHRLYRWAGNGPVGVWVAGAVHLVVDVDRMVQRECAFIELTLAKAKGYGEDYVFKFPLAFPETPVYTDQTQTTDG
jgi:hypothetical protein